MSEAVPLYAIEATALAFARASAPHADGRPAEVGYAGIRGGRIDERRVGAFTWDDDGVDEAAAEAALARDAVIGIWDERAGQWLGELATDVGQTRTTFRLLDVGLLAQAADPEHRGASLAELARALDIEFGETATASQRAELIALVFLALVPRLREVGVHTLAGAEETCRKLRAPEIQEEPSEGPGADRTPFRIDTHPYRRRVFDVMNPARFIAPDARMSDAIRTMTRDGISSLFVAQIGSDGVQPLAAETGIVTERDVLRALDARGAQALTQPVGEIATRPLIAVPFDAFLYRAIGRLARLRVRHLGVSAEDGRITGAISVRDLLMARADEALWLGDEIEDADTPQALARAWANLPLVAESLAGEGMRGPEIASIVAREFGAVTRRAFVLAERQMLAEGRGTPPSGYAVALAGPGGRGESLLSDPQQTLVILDGAEASAPAAEWFAALTERAATILQEVGIAREDRPAEARLGTLSAFRDRLGETILDAAGAQALDPALFDLRGVHGKAALALTLRDDATRMAAREVQFCRRLARRLREAPRGLSVFGSFRTSAGHLDVGASGLSPIVEAARVLAICYGVRERGTIGRLQVLKHLAPARAAELDHITEAFGTMVDLLLRQQINDARLGQPPSSALELAQLSPAGKRELRSALQLVRGLGELVRDLIGRAG